MSTSMSLRSFTFALLALVVTGCPQKAATTPAVVAFTASESRVAAGAEITLSWKVEHATSITLAEAGMGALTTIAEDAFEGSTTVKVERSSVYVLTARGEAGSDTRLVAVDVASESNPPVVPNVPEAAPTVVEFSASSPTAAPGEAVTLTWRTTGATRVTLSSADRGELSSTTGTQAGSFTDTVPASLPPDGVVTYTLTVDGNAGTTTRTLDVFAPGKLSIQTFRAPKYARAGGPVPVSWWTSGAASVELLVEGAVVYRTATTADAAHGSHSLFAPSSDFAVVLRATGPRGDVMTKTASVELATPPLSATLTSNLTQVSAGTKATLTWSAPNARRAVIKGSDGVTVLSLFGPDAEGGTVDVAPNETTTYDLAADATVGDPPMTASVVVSLTGAPGTLTSMPRGTPVTGVLVPLAYGTAPGTLIHGLPHTQVLVNSVSGFEDISDTGERLVLSPAADDEALTVDPKFETWLFSSRVSGKITISTNGYFHFGESLLSLPKEHPFPNANIPANTIAPFWDDLRLNEKSAIFWEVRGEAPERRLIVQWSHLQVAGDGDTDVTFQAQLHQIGRVILSYGTMKLPTPNHWAFSAGVQGSAREQGIGRTATPASNSSVDFFAPVANGTPVTMWPGIPHRGFVKLGQSYLHLQGPRAARLSDLAITEVMAQPSVAQGQYVEIHNRGPIAVDLLDWQLSASGSQTVSFDGGTVPAGGMLVLGATTDRSANDDAGVDLAWPSAFGLSSAVNASAALTFAPDASVAVSWDGGVSGPGIATTFDPGPFLVTFNATPMSSACKATGTFGSQQGSPGRITGCGFAYRVEAIPGAFFDISASGTRVFNSGQLITTRLSLPPTAGPAPVIYGQPRPDLWVSGNGWIVYASAAPSMSGGNINDTYPSQTPQLQGMLAPFWDMLYAVPGGPTVDVYWKRTAQGEDASAPAPHWVFQWHRYSFWYSDGDEANFQVKLFDDGTVEYHYGAMLNRSTANLALGSSATIWLSNPVGNQALVVGVNSPVITPNSGYRFRPQP